MSTTNANFDGIHVSKGFVRGLQGQVFRLEQNQQSLIQQLEHANNLATEYHAAAVAWQHKYDTALHEMDEMRQAFERETQLRLAHEHDITYLERLLAQQQSAMSISPARPRRDIESSSEPMSPVSIPSSPRKATTKIHAPTTTPTTTTTTTTTTYDREHIKKQLCIEEDTSTPFDKNDEHVVMRDGKKIKQSVCYGFGGMPWYDEKEMTTSEDEDSDDIDIDDGEYHEDEDDGIDWLQRERDDWTASIRASARASSEERDN